MPFSALVRQRLNELGLPFVVRPVPVDPGERTAMQEPTGTDRIPAVNLEDRTVLGDDAEDIVREL